MKTLFLLRHAKSSWSNPGLKDFDRPLAARGREAALKMGAFMAEKDLHPELVLSSSSARTRQTLARFEKGYGRELNAQFLDDLYGAWPDVMLDLIQNAPEGVQSLMLVAHNPGMHEAAMQFLDGGDKAAMAEMDYKFPTGALAQFEFETTTWPGVKFGAGKLVRFVKPRDL